MDYIIAVDGGCAYSECFLWQKNRHECTLTTLDCERPNCETGCFDYEYIDKEYVVGEPKVIIFK